jgi:hypothetical protein
MDNTSSEKKVGRPRVKVRRKRVTLTLHPEIHDEASRFAFQTHRSLSGLVELSLRQVIEGNNEAEDPPVHGSATPQPATQN